MNYKLHIFSCLETFVGNFDLWYTRKRGMYKQSIVWAPEEEEESVDSSIIEAKEMAQKIIQNVEKVMVGWLLLVHPDGDAIGVNGLGINLSM